MAKYFVDLEVQLEVKCDECNVGMEYYSDVNKISVIPCKNCTPIKEKENGNN